MESSIRSRWDDQVKFFKPETVFRKDNVHNQELSVLPFGLRLCSAFISC
jgi:hypothetical protein